MRRNSHLQACLGVAFMLIVLASCGHGGDDPVVRTPGPPKGLEAAVADGVVYLSWENPSLDLSYAVKRSGTAGGPWTEIDRDIQGGAFADAGLTGGRTHFYRVSASNLYGEGPDSEEIRVVPIPSLVPPTAPEWLVALPGDARMTLSWDAVQGAVAYDLRRSLMPEGPYEAVGGGPLTATSIVDEGLANDTTYYYVVAASNPAGAGPDSGIESATPVSPSAAPDPPAGCSTLAGDTWISITWPPSARATFFTVQEAPAPQGPYSIVATTTGCSFAHTGLQNGLPVFYVVTATNSAGESAPTSPTAATPVAAVAPPPPPGGLGANSGNAQVWISWTGSREASGYLVKRSQTAGGPYTTIATVMQPRFRDVGMVNGMVEYYAVCAFNTAGQSAPSGEVHSRPAADFPPPAGVQAYSGDGESAVAWSAAPGADRYLVRRSVAGGPYIPAVTTSDLHYEESGLVNGTRYSYTVSCENSDGESLQSDPVTATPEEAPPATCGLTGLEAILLLAALRLARRR